LWSGFDSRQLHNKGRRSAAFIGWIRVAVSSQLGVMHFLVIDYDCPDCDRIVAWSVCCLPDQLTKFLAS
jgi:hypothetical protein